MPRRNNGESVRLKSRHEGGRLSGMESELHDQWQRWQARDARRREEREQTRMIRQLTETYGGTK
jgi:hypothetical protein